MPTFGSVLPNLENSQLLPRFVSSLAAQTGYRQFYFILMQLQAPLEPSDRYHRTPEVVLRAFTALSPKQHSQSLRSGSEVFQGSFLECENRHIPFPPLLESY